MCQQTLATPRSPAPGTVWRLLTEIAGWPQAAVRAPSVQTDPTGERDMWQQRFDTLTSAAPATVWRLFADVAGWPRWNAGIEAIALHGPFVEGTTFTMKPPGEDAMTSTLRHVVAGRSFEDETVLGEVRVHVEHRVEAAVGGRTRIAYAARVEGPDAADVGAAVTADFPLVLAALAALAEHEEAAAHA